MVAVKICGLTTEEAVRAARAADYAGFVYFPASPRHLTIERAATLRTLLPSSVKAVSVLVDPDDTLLKQVTETLAPDYLQLHGHETPERVKAIKEKSKTRIIKAIPVRASDDVAQAMRFAKIADMLLFDAKPPAGGFPGGNALSFDWALLKNRTFPLPWMLSGGLNADNAAEAIHQSGAPAVDVSSGVERAPGVKDPALIDAFIMAARNA